MEDGGLVLKVNSRCVFIWLHFCTVSEKKSLIGEDVVAILKPWVTIHLRQNCNLDIFLNALQTSSRKLLTMSSL